jgi:hypothetical protein
VGGGVMVPEKYANLGFEIVRFVASSKVLRFAQTPVFVFNSKARIDAQFITHICEAYLKISEKRKNLTCIKC